jgi:hypothetical protein
MKAMLYKKTEIIQKIVSNLAFLSRSTSLENVIGLFDSNRTSQSFFKGLFNRIFDLKLDELDIESGITNYPAIDLGDKKEKIAIQVTADSSSTKIKKTIDIFQTNKKCAGFSRLVIFIIGDKENYTTKFVTNGSFEFIPSRDIWDEKYLITEINKIQDTDKLEGILKFLKEELSEFMFPEIFTQEDIKDCIAILKRDFGSAHSIRTSIEPRLGDDFMLKKNSVNNISWDFFKEKIRVHIKYNKDINDFLTDPINKDSQNSYFEVTQAIQDYYHKQQQPYSFENIFRDVFAKLCNYDDEVPGLNMKLKIVLHNMYFNCDVGDNPNENS